MEDGVLDVSQSTTSSTSSSSVIQVDTHLQFLDHWRSITFNGLVLNMVKGHHLQLRCYPLLFHNFKSFEIKATKAHHPVIPKKVDELLTMGAIEPSTGGAGFTSIMLAYYSTILG